MKNKTVCLFMLACFASLFAVANQSSNWPGIYYYIRATTTTTEKSTPCKKEKKDYTEEFEMLTTFS
jgi:hypothetical protein